MPGQPDDYLVVNGELVSADALKERTATPTKRNRFLALLGFALRHVRVTILVLAIPVALVSANWKLLDKYFPKVNAYLHSGVSDQDDVDYQVYKLTEDIGAYSKQVSVCNSDKASFDECRTAYIAAEPRLDSLHTRFLSVHSVWERELKERSSMPSSCRQIGTQTYAALWSYLYQEKRLVVLLRRTDSKSASSMGTMAKEYDEIKPALAASAAEMQAIPPWPKECADY